MKFGQFIEYNMKNIFCEKSYTNAGTGTCTLRTSKKIKIEHILLSPVWTCIWFVFIVCSSWELQKCTENYVHHLLLTHVKPFQKIKRGLKLVPLHQFLNFIVQLTLFPEILVKMYIVIICSPIFNIRNFEINFKMSPVTTLFVYIYF